MAIQWRYSVNDNRITAAIATMEQNLENVVPIDAVAQRRERFPETTRRLWHQHFNMTPQRFYLNIRLTEARRLLRESTDPSRLSPCAAVSYRPHIWVAPFAQHMVTVLVKSGVNPTRPSTGIDAPT